MVVFLACVFFLVQLCFFVWSESFLFGVRTIKYFNLRKDGRWKHKFLVTTKIFACET